MWQSVAHANSSDATLSALGLTSRANGWAFVLLVSEPDTGTDSHSWDVPNFVSTMTVTPFLKDSQASYVIKLDGVTDPDATVSLAVGSNVITVEVTAADNTTTTTNTYTVTVTRASNTPATGAPTISGTGQVGQALTANTSGIEDADGLDNAAFSYQLLADDTAITDATGNSYTFVDADEGKAVKVKVSFTDDAGNGETLTSAATAAIEAAVEEEEPTEPPPRRRT